MSEELVCPNPQCARSIHVSTKNGRPWYWCRGCGWEYNADGDYEKHPQKGENTGRG